VYRDDWLMVVDKPAGLPTQPPPRGGDALSLRVRKELDGKTYLGELHRLDRDVSGLVMYGMRPDSTADLAEQLRYHRATRRYLGLVHTALNEPIREISPGRMGLHPAGMPARTHVMPLDFAPDAKIALVLVALETGRSHQIRLHLAWSAGALLGDRQYGDTVALPRIGLHAAMLRLRHPHDREQCTWTLPPPDDFWALANGAQLQLPADWAQINPKQE
jgi:23S rRNA-/tRNA-specific pseudouridylate synthase